MPGRDPDALTAREREVLALLRVGLTNEEIAGRLGVTLDGAKYHVSQILSKLGVATREEAAALAPERRRWWAGWPLAAKAAGAAVVLAAVVGLGVLAWGVIATEGGESEEVLQGSDRSDDSAPHMVVDIGDVPPIPLSEAEEMLETGQVFQVWIAVTVFPPVEDHRYEYTDSSGETTTWRIGGQDVRVFIRNASSARPVMSEDGRSLGLSEERLQQLVAKADDLGIEVYDQRTDPELQTLR